MEGRSLEPTDGPGLNSLIFPTYNPGPLLEQTCAAVTRFLEQSPDDWEILFVCDGCTDGSPDYLTRFARSCPERIRLVQHAPNRGKGYAVRRGLLAARGQWRLFTDVDLAYGFDDVCRVAQALRAGADLAIASRTHPESRLVVLPGLEGYVFRRHLQSQIFSALVRLLLPLTQRDTQAGLKGLSAAAVRLLVPRLRCDGFGFDCELLTAGVRHGLTIAEVPIWVRYEGAPTTTNVRTMGRMIRELWRIRRNWRPEAVAPTRRTEPLPHPGQRAA